MAPAAGIAVLQFCQFQQGMIGAVLRTITTEIPTLGELDLPPILKDVVMNKRGLVIVVGGTGSGKSTTLAAIIRKMNEEKPIHIGKPVERDRVR